MEKLKYILLAFVIFMTNCDDEAIIDYLPKWEWYFWIVNGTERTIKIKIDRGININNRPENYEIPPADSIVTAESNGSEYWPFCDHNALILIDDTLALSVLLSFRRLQLWWKVLWWNVSPFSQLWNSYA